MHTTSSTISDAGVSISVNPIITSQIIGSQIEENNNNNNNNNDIPIISTEIKEPVVSISDYEMTTTRSSSLSSKESLSSAISKDDEEDEEEEEDDEKSDSQTGDIQIPLTQDSTYFNSLVDRLTIDNSLELLVKYTQSLQDELQEAYESSCKSKNPKTFIPTKVLVPTNQETGKYLVIDIGGSTLRICVMELFKNNYQILMNKQYQINNDLKIIDLKFFNWVSSIAESLLFDNTEHGKNGGSKYFQRDEIIKTGISWSFPIEQTHSNVGYINTVSKGYTLTEETIGKNLSDLFENSFKLNNINIKVNSIINDAVAVYISGLFIENCEIGLVLGTGINSSFKIKNQIYNSELSFFGSCCCHSLSNELDLNIDSNYKLENLKYHLINNGLKSSSQEEEEEESDNDNDGIKDEIFQPLEYMCAGRYIPELVRYGIVKLHERGEIFKDNLPKIFNKSYDLNGEFITLIYENSIEEINNHLNANYQFQLAINDYNKIYKLIDLIINRASILMASTILSQVKLSYQYSSSLESINRKSKEIKIGYVGSTLQFFNSYRDKIENYVNYYTENFNLPNIKLVHIDNSSVLGAAVTASTFDLKEAGKN
ncbi:hypothetical protein B5S33_g1434 [[Candida] boidinii]|nr:hypothetical protein B5S33_g1434 [[Candida] boidinii]